MAVKRDWHWEDIKAAIRKRGMSLAALSVSGGFSSVAISQLNFNSIPRVQAVVAAFLNVRPEDIWPSRYDEEGQPIGPRHPRRSQTSAGSRATSPQKRDAA